MLSPVRIHRQTPDARKQDRPRVHLRGSSSVSPAAVWLSKADHQVIQCNIRDITERSRLEKLLQAQSRELENLHLRKDEFLAMLSHELRSPLAPIANAVQLMSLQQETESRTQKQARNIIERQLGKLQRLVDDLLEVSRITSGRVQLRKEWVAVSGFIHGAIETARPLIQQRRHELTISMPVIPIWLSADAARLEQVVIIGARRWELCMWKLLIPRLTFSQTAG